MTNRQELQNTGEFMPKEKPYLRNEVERLPDGAMQSVGFSGEGEYWYLTDHSTFYRGFWIKPDGKIVELIANPALRRPA